MKVTAGSLSSTSSGNNNDVTGGGRKTTISTTIISTTESVEGEDAVIVNVENDDAIAPSYLDEVVSLDSEEESDDDEEELTEEESKSQRWLWYQVSSVSALLECYYYLYVGASDMRVPFVFTQAKIHKQ